MRTTIVTLLIITAAGSASAFPAAGDEAPAELDVRLQIEPLVVDAEGFHPLNSLAAQPVKPHGAYHRVVRLGEDAQGWVRFKLSYEPSGEGIALTLERTLSRDGQDEETLPIHTHRIALTESWTTKILEDTGRGGQLLLRVVPLLHRAVQDEPFRSDSLQMHFRGGPLVLFGDSRDEDRIVFRRVNVGGKGLRLGIPGVGELILTTEPVDGAVACGYVRGHEWAATIDGRALGGWSTEKILPDDPLRPGAGWILYGRLDAAADVGRGFYGTYQP